MCSGYTESPWCWHDRDVGKWVLDIPLNKDKLKIYGRAYVLDIVSDVMGIASDIYLVTGIECPAGHRLFDGSQPLSPGTVIEAVETAWADGGISPLPDIHLYGMSYVFAQINVMISRALLPNSLCFSFRPTLSGDMPGVRIVVRTNCDIWLEKTLSGDNNIAVGSLNGEMLTEKLAELENRLCGRIISCSTDFPEVEIGPYVLRNK